MDVKDKKMEELYVTRKTLSDEYESIKAFLLQKVNRMEEIEHIISSIDNELNKRQTKQ